MENQVKQISKTGAIQFQSGLDKWLEDNTKEIAINLINIGLTNEQIAFSTKLDIKIIQNLRKLTNKFHQDYKTGLIV